MDELVLKVNGWQNTIFRVRTPSPCLTYIAIEPAVVETASASSAHRFSPHLNLKPKMVNLPSESGRLAIDASRGSLPSKQITDCSDKLSGRNF